jgi:hypothetical protein
VRRTTRRQTTTTTTTNTDDDDRRRTTTCRGVLEARACGEGGGVSWRRRGRKDQDVVVVGG